MNDYFKKMCLPAKIYLAILIFTIIIAIFQGIGLIAVLFKTVFGLIWMWILNWICSKGYTNLSWVLLLLPYVIMFLIVATTVEVVRILKNEQPIIVDVVETKKTVTESNIITPNISADLAMR